MSRSLRAGNSTTTTVLPALAPGRRGTSRASNGEGEGPGREEDVLRLRRRSFGSLRRLACRAGWGTAGSSQHLGTHHWRFPKRVSGLLQLSPENGPQDKQKPP